MSATLVGLIAVACTTPPRAPAGTGYLGSAPHRRALLERSLVNRANAYAQLRLAHYPDDWDRLPEWNPKVAASDEAPRALALDMPLAALGEEAFLRYPVQIVPALQSREHAVVDVSLDGSHALAVTCATCHARRDESGVLVPGVANDRFDYGRMLVSGGTPGDEAQARARLAWGPGRMDVTTLRGDEIVRIPDLRPVRYLGYLHHAATVKAGDVETLAVRLETLVIVSNGETLRPPRAVALGLATYLFDLADTLPSRAAISDEERSGQSLFGARCARCHVPPSFTGVPVSAAEVGTDPRLAHSPDRGTGMYRVPSLRGVSTRGALLHDGTVKDLDALLDPARRTGHAYGHDLDARDRHALVAYLRTL